MLDAWLAVDHHVAHLELPMKIMNFTDVQHASLCLIVLALVALPSLLIVRFKART